MFFAYHSRSLPTGELLARALQMPHGINPGDATGECLIRWGNRRDPASDGNFDRVLNSENAIDLCSHKLYSLELMSSFEEFDIKVPEFDEDAESLIERVGYPLLGRKYRHARGEDIELILQKRDLRRSQSDYYVQYIPTNREFRIHVVGDKVIRIQGKYLDNPEERKPWIRNFSTGYRFRKPRLRLRQDRLDMAVASVKSLGLAFGAVDLIVAENGSCYILEVNTAPSCSPLTIGAYAVALHELANLDTEIDLNFLDMLDPNLVEMDSDDEYEEGDI